jgi:Holliday junction resolvasome RuvABC endonuclease subunit
MIVVGIDPGLQVCGYAVIKAELLRTTLLEAGVFRTDGKKRLEQRLCQLARICGRWWKSIDRVSWLSSSCIRIISIRGRQF